MTHVAVSIHSKSKGNNAMWKVLTLAVERAFYAAGSAFAAVNISATSNTTADLKGAGIAAGVAALASLGNSFRVASNGNTSS